MADEFDENETDGFIENAAADFVNASIKAEASEIREGITDNTSDENSSIQENTNALIANTHAQKALNDEKQKTITIDQAINNAIQESLKQKNEISIYRSGDAKNPVYGGGTTITKNNNESTHLNSGSFWTLTENDAEEFLDNSRALVKANVDYDKLFKITDSKGKFWNDLNFFGFDNSDERKESLEILSKIKNIDPKIKDYKTAASEGKNPPFSYEEFSELRKEAIELTQKIKSINKSLDDPRSFSNDFNILNQKDFNPKTTDTISYILQNKFDKNGVYFDGVKDSSGFNTQISLSNEKFNDTVSSVSLLNPNGNDTYSLENIISDINLKLNNLDNKTRDSFAKNETNNKNNEISEFKDIKLDSDSIMQEIGDAFRDKMISSIEKIDSKTLTLNAGSNTYNIKADNVNDLILTNDGRAYITDNADNIIATKDPWNLGKTDNQHRIVEGSSGKVIGLLNDNDTNTLKSLTEALTNFENIKSYINKLDQNIDKLKNSTVSPENEKIKQDSISLFTTQKDELSYILKDEKYIIDKYEELKNKAINNAVNTLPTGNDILSQQKLERQENLLNRKYDLINALYTEKIPFEKVYSNPLYPTETIQTQKDTGGFSREELLSQIEVTRNQNIIEEKISDSLNIIQSKLDNNIIKLSEFKQKDILSDFSDSTNAAKNSSLLRIESGENATTVLNDFENALNNCVKAAERGIEIYTRYTENYQKNIDSIRSKYVDFFGDKSKKENEIRNANETYSSFNTIQDDKDIMLLRSFMSELEGLKSYMAKIQEQPFMTMGEKNMVSGFNERKASLGSFADKDVVAMYSSMIIDLNKTIKNISNNIKTEKAKKSGANKEYIEQEEELKKYNEAKVEEFKNIIASASGSGLLKEFQDSRENIINLRDKFAESGITDNEKIQISKELNSETEKYEDTLSKLIVAIKGVNAETEEQIKQHKMEKRNAANKAYSETQSGYGKTNYRDYWKYALARDRKQQIEFLSTMPANFSTTGNIRESFLKTVYNKSVGFRQQRGLAGFAANIGYNASGTALSIGFGLLGKAATDAGKAVYNFSKEAINAYGQLQQIKTNLGIVYGSQSEADQTFSNIAAYSVKSPFGVQTVSEYAVLLKQSGIYASDLMTTLKQIGDVAGGNQQKFANIANSFAQIEANGKATTRQLRQFATAGVPIYKELTKAYEQLNGQNVGIDQIRKLTEQGKISSLVIEQAFKNMTGPGGTFENAVNIGAKTWKARIQNLQDARQLAASQVGEMMIELGGNGQGDSYAQKALTFFENFWNNIDNVATFVNLDKNVKNISEQRGRVEKLEFIYNLLKEDSNTSKEVLDYYQQLITDEDNKIDPERQRAKNAAMYDYYFNKVDGMNALSSQEIIRLEGVVKNGDKYSINKKDNSFWKWNEDYTARIPVAEEEYVKAIREATEATQILSNSIKKSKFTLYTKEMGKYEIDKVISSINTSISNTEELYDKAINKNPSGVYAFYQKSENAWQNSTKGKEEQQNKEKQEWENTRNRQKEYNKMFDDNGNLIKNFNGSIKDAVNAINEGVIIPLEKIELKPEDIAKDYPASRLTDSEKESERQKNMLDNWNYGLNSLEQNIQSILLSGGISSEPALLLRNLWDSLYKQTPNGIERIDNTEENVGYLSQILYNTIKSLESGGNDDIALLLKKSFIKGTKTGDIKPYDDVNNNGKVVDPLWRRVMSSTLGTDITMMREMNLSGRKTVELFDKKSQQDLVKNVSKALLSTRTSFKDVAGMVTRKPGEVNRYDKTTMLDFKETGKTLSDFALSLESATEVTHAYVSSLESQVNSLEEFLSSSISQTEEGQNIVDSAYAQFLGQYANKFEAVDMQAFDAMFKKLDDGTIIFKEGAIDAANALYEQRKGALDVANAASTLKDSLKSLTDAIKENQREIDINTGLIGTEDFFKGTSTEVQKAFFKALGNQTFDEKTISSLSKVTGLNFTKETPTQEIVDALTSLDIKGLYSKVVTDNEGRQSRKYELSDITDKYLDSSVIEKLTDAEDRLQATINWYAAKREEQKQAIPKYNELLQKRDDYASGKITLTLSEIEQLNADLALYNEKIEERRKILLDEGVAIDAENRKVAEVKGEVEQNRLAKLAEANSLISKNQEGFDSEMLTSISALQTLLENLLEQAKVSVEQQKTLAESTGWGKINGVVTGTASDPVTKFNKFKNTNYSDANGNDRLLSPLYKILGFGESVRYGNSFRQQRTLDYMGIQNETFDDVISRQYGDIKKYRRDIDPYNKRIYLYNQGYINYKQSAIERMEEGQKNVTNAFYGDKNAYRAKAGNLIDNYLNAQNFNGRNFKIKDLDIEGVTTKEGLLDAMMGDPEKAISAIDKMTTGISRFKKATEDTEAIFDELGDKILNTFKDSLLNGFNDSAKLMGESFIKLKNNIWDSETASEKMEKCWKDIAKDMLAAIGPALTQAGLQLAISAPTWQEKVSGLLLAASGGIISFTSGMINPDKDDKDKNKAEEARLNSLRQMLSDLIDQAKVDAEYYQKNYLHKNALSSNEAVSYQSVNDAIITPSGNVITTHPDDYLIATKTPGSLAGTNGDVRVNFTLIDQSTGGKVQVKSQETTKNGDGSIDIKAVVVACMNQAIADGSCDQGFNAMNRRLNGRSFS